MIEGDAREVLESMDADSLDAIITDPPYDLGTRQHTATGTTRPHMGRGRSYHQWDLDANTLGQMFRVLRKKRPWNTLSTKRRRGGRFPMGGGALLLFAPPLTRSSWRRIVALLDLAESLGFVFYGSITWDQGIKGMGYDCGRNQKNDLLLFTAGNRNGVLWDLGLPNVVRERRLLRRKGEHEAEKPAGLFLRLVEALTRPGDVVADLFAGRGRWIRPVLERGRHVVAVDKNPAWTRRILGDLAQKGISPSPF